MNIRKVLCLVTTFLWLTLLTTGAAMPGDPSPKQLTVQLYPGLTLEGWLAQGDGKQQLRTSEFRSLQWNTEFAVGKHAQETAKVSNCEQYFKAKQTESEPLKEYERGPYMEVGLLCEAFAAVADAADSKTSFVRSIVVDKRFAQLAPATIGLFASETEFKRMAHSSKSWAGVQKIARVTKRSPEAAEFILPNGNQEVEILARADFDRDHIEDLLILTKAKVKDGSFASTRLFTLTRMSADRKLKLLTEYKVYK